MKNQSQNIKKTDYLMTASFVMETESRKDEKNAQSSP